MSTALASTVRWGVVAASAAVLLGCAQLPRAVDCESNLTPINAPAPKVIPPAADEPPPDGEP